MVSRETRVYLAGLGLAVVVAAIALNTNLGIDPAIYWLLIFPGVSFLAPQLYLAATGEATEGVAPRTRLWIALGVSGVYTFGTAALSPADDPIRVPFALVGACLLAMLVVVELRWRAGGTPE